MSKESQLPDLSKWDENDWQQLFSAQEVAIEPGLGISDDEINRITEYPHNIECTYEFGAAKIPISVEINNNCTICKIILTSLSLATLGNSPSETISFNLSMPDYQLFLKAFFNDQTIPHLNARNLIKEVQIRFINRKSEHSSLPVPRFEFNRFKFNHNKHNNPNKNFTHDLKHSGYLAIPTNVKKILYEKLHNYITQLEHAKAVFETTGENPDDLQWQPSQESSELFSGLETALQTDYDKEHSKATQPIKLLTDKQSVPLVQAKFDFAEQPEAPFVDDETIDKYVNTPFFISYEYIDRSEQTPVSRLISIANSGESAFIMLTANAHNKIDSMICNERTEMISFKIDAQKLRAFFAFVFNNELIPKVSDIVGDGTDQRLRIRTAVTTQQESPDQENDYLPVPRLDFQIIKYIEDPHNPNDFIEQFRSVRYLGITQRIRQDIKLAIKLSIKNQSKNNDT